MVGRLLLESSVLVGGSVVRVANIGDIARVGIGDGILDGLEATVGQLGRFSKLVAGFWRDFVTLSTYLDIVLAVGGVSVTSLVLSVLDLVLVAILSVDAVLIIVLGRGGLIGRLMVVLL
jgi:hypothetical protein